MLGNSRGLNLGNPYSGTDRAHRLDYLLPAYLGLRLLGLLSERILRAQAPATAVVGSFDSYYHALRASQWFNTGARKSGLTNPAHTIRSRIVKALARLDQHV
jgi:hypothetical protein